ncbi:MAG: DUF1178 family protein [Candidatus Cloacimonetes bacterium]|nr:DUF1178 family protein [Candidatus Cloacimonadota bacterium]
MIAFDLICSNGHKFECWFKDSDSFEKKRSFGIIHCPVCNDNQVEKTFSTFAIKKYSNKKEEKKEEKIDPHQAYQALQFITEYVNKNFEDVGLNFTKEALKIHFGEAEKRNIKGLALPDEEKILQEEGVPFLKLPVLKHLDN